MAGQIVEAGVYIFRMILIVFRINTFAPLSPVGPTPLVGSLVWEGVAEEEVQAGRGVGVDEVCVHPPYYQATIFCQGCPPIFQIKKNYLGPLQPPLGCQSPPCPPPPVPIGVYAGVRPL